MEIYFVFKNWYFNALDSFIWTCFFFKWAKRKNEIIEKTEKLRLFEKYFTFPLKTYRVHGFCTIGQYGTSEI